MGWRIAIAIAAGLAFVSGAVHAQSSPDVAVAAEAAVQRGLEATARGDHAAALDAYYEAARLVPNANVPHKLAGEALEALGRWVDAMAEYDRYLALNPTGKAAPDVRARLDRIAQDHVATLEAQCAPDGAEVLLDGRLVGVTPLGPVRVLAPGRYALEIRAVGRISQSESIQIAAGAAHVIRCELPPISLNLPPPAPDAPNVDRVLASPRPWYKRRAVLIPAVGVAVVGAIVGAYFLTRPGVPDSDGGAHSFP